MDLIWIGFSFDSIEKKKFHHSISLLIKNFFKQEVNDYVTSANAITKQQARTSFRFLDIEKFPKHPRDRKGIEKSQ